MQPHIPTYQIVLTGLRPGVAQSDAKAKLAALFKASAGQIETILATPGYCLKKGITLALAADYRNAIEAVGGACAVIEEQAQPTSIKRPEDALSYPYQVSLALVLTCALFFGVIGIVAVDTAMANHRGLIINGIIHLSENGATLFYWFISASCAVLVGAAAAPMLAGKKFVTLSESALAAPRHAFSKQNSSIPYNEIQSITVQTVQKFRLMHIHHAKGKLTIPEGFLPNANAFDELRSAIAARIPGRSG